MALKCKLKDQKSFDSGYHALRDDSELSESVEEQSPAGEYSPAASLVSSAYCSRKSGDLIPIGDIPSNLLSEEETLFAIEEMPTPDNTEDSFGLQDSHFSRQDSPTQDLDRLEEDATVDELEKKLEKMELELKMARKEATFAVQELETKMAQKDSEINKLRDEMKSFEQHLSLLEAEKDRHETEIEHSKRKLEVTKKEFEAIMCESEMKILAHIKAVSKVQAEKDRLKCLLAEKNLSELKVKKASVRAKRDEAKAEYESVRAELIRRSTTS